MTFVDHLSELRKRLFISLIAFIAAFSAAFAHTRQIAEYLVKPAGDLSFVFLAPSELFMTYIKVALFAGLALSSPVMLYELWMFVSPGLTSRERRAVFFALVCGAILFLIGAVFAYYVIIPFMLRFFLSYSFQRVEAFLSINEYFGFVFSLILAFGAAFELPIAAWILGAFGVLKAETLIKYRYVAVLVIFIAAAIITPPDVISQVLLGIPMCGLYELSIINLKILEKRQAKIVKGTQEDQR
jgi:sec-independent protein translocase protein TatC